MQNARSSLAISDFNLFEKSVGDSLEFGSKSMALTRHGKVIGYLVPKKLMSSSPEAYQPPTRDGKLNKVRELLIAALAESGAEEFEAIKEIQAGVDAAMRKMGKLGPQTPGHSPPAP
jgi:hypothetical protein